MKESFSEKVVQNEDMSTGEYDTMMEKYDKLAPALVEALSQFPTISKNASGYGYKYATLDDILTTVKPILHANGLVITQLLDSEGIKTILMHSSGQTLESTFPLPELSSKGMNAAQATGAAVTYIRRYAISSMLNLATDEDTDGTTKTKSPSSNNTSPAPAKTGGSMGFEKALPKETDAGKSQATESAEKVVEEPQKENPPAETPQAIPQEGKEVNWDKSHRDAENLCSRNQQNFIFNLAMRVFESDDFTVDDVAGWTGIPAESFVDTTPELFCSKLNKMDATKVVSTLKNILGMD